MEEKITMQLPILLLTVVATTAVLTQAVPPAGNFDRMLQYLANPSNFFAIFLKHATQFCLADRESVITQAIAEAKEHAKKQSLAREANVQAMKTTKLTSGQMVGRLFKKPTKMAQKMGEARLMFEDMVHRAERKMAEIKRKSHAEVQSAEQRADELANELFHKPGTMLTEEETARMLEESGCQEIRERPVCDYPLAWFVRTIDGTCNNVRNPLFGASATSFTRMINAEYEDGIASLRGGLQNRQGDLVDIDPFVPPNPSARLVSKTISFRNETLEETPFTHILMQWGQFLDHDMDLSPELEPIPECEDCKFTEVCEPIRVQEDDTAFGVGTLQNGRCLRFARSLPSCDESPPGSLAAREQLNDLTSFIDGSQIYGSNEIIGNAVRMFEDGLLLEGKRFPGNQPALPIDTKDLVACLNAEGCFLAGDVRANEQISLTIMHTLWFREHNRIARELKSINPFWNDERLFQEARKIVGALIQKITYDDYLPKVLGQTTFDLLIGPYPGYDPRVDPGIPNAFATAAYRYGHSLVRPQFDRLDQNFRPMAMGPLPLVEAFFNPGQFKKSLGTDPIVRGLISTQALRFDPFLTPTLTTMLFAGKNRPGMDLAALNIQRGRDHGLPPYLTWVNYCRERYPHLNVNGMFDPSTNLVRFLQLYGSQDTIDLWIGGLAEQRLPDAFFGSVFACIFGVTFDNVRNGDRFWHENRGVFTPNQLAEIKKGSLSRIICDNSDNIRQIQPDAFRGDQQRVTCLKIPSVDLEQWREDGCFARVNVMPINTPVIIRTFSRPLTRRNISYFSQSFEDNRMNQFQCMPVACPRRGSVVLFDSNMRRAVQIMANANLPSNMCPLNNRYRAIWRENVFAQSENGVFTSQSSCETSTAVAITISMGADMQQDQEEEDDSEELEREREMLFDVKEPDTPMPSQNGGGAEEAVNEVSDQDLAAQLEQALRDLEL